MEFIADPAAFEPDRFSWKQMQKGGLIKGRLPDGEERILAYIIEREPQEMERREIPHTATTMLEARAARRRVGFLFV